jgi:hypothetical protein
MKNPADTTNPNAAEAASQTTPQAPAPVRLSPALGRPSAPLLFHEAPRAARNRPLPGKAANQPVHHIRHGVISASIWRQQTAKGAVFNVTFQRSYKDGEDWKTSASFGRGNLLVLSLIAARAYEWISNQRPEHPRQ